MNNAPLNAVITDPRVRRAIYAAYTIIAFVAAAVTVGLASTGEIPQWDVTLNTVLAFVGAGVGGLAVSNTNASPAAVREAEQQTK